MSQWALLVRGIAISYFYPHHSVQGKAKEETGQWSQWLAKVNANSKHCATSAFFSLEARFRLGQNDWMSSPLFWTTFLGLIRIFTSINPIVFCYHTSFKLSYELKANVPKVLREKFILEDFLSWPIFFYCFINLFDFYHYKFKRRVFDLSLSSADLLPVYPFPRKKWRHQNNFNVPFFFLFFSLLSSLFPFLSPFLFLSVSSTQEIDPLSPHHGKNSFQHQE